MESDVDLLFRGGIRRGEIAGLIGVCGGESRRGAELGPKALVLAVLEESIRDYLSGSAIARSRTEAWMRGSGAAGAFSFVGVCEVLGFEPTSVRAALERVRAANGRGRLAGRSRRNARRRSTLR